MNFLGEGEWKRKKHQPEYRHQWRKLHIAIDAKTLQIIEQEHLFITKRVRAMLEFKSFRSEKIIFSGIELMHMIRKEQFSFSKELQNSLGLFCAKIG